MKRIVLLLTILFNVVYADIDIALPETVIGQDISAIKKVFSGGETIEPGNVSYWKVEGNCGTGSTSNVNEYTISKKVGHAWREYIFNYFGYAGSSKFRKGLNNKVIRYKIIFERGGFPNLYSDTYLYDIVRSKIGKYFNEKELEKFDKVEHASTDGVYRKDVLIKKSKKTVKFTIHDLNMKDIPYEAYSYTGFYAYTHDSGKTDTFLKTTLIFEPEVYFSIASCGFVKQYYPILKKPRKAVNMLE